jgi:hypothetical protein
MSLAVQLLAIYPDLDLFETVQIVDEGSGPYIAVWLDPRPQPTPDELSAATVLAMRSKRFLELKLACKTEIESGFYSSALGTQHKYDSALPQDQINLTGAKLAGVDMEFTCTDEFGVKWQRPHTAAQISTVYADGMLHIQAAKSTLYAKLSQLNAAADIDAVNAVTWQ